MYLINLDRINLLNYLPQEGVVAEIGVKRGKYAKKILELSNPKLLYLIDPWDNEKGDYIKSNCDTLEKMSKHYKNTLKDFERSIKNGKVKVIKDFSYNVFSNFSNSYFDWIYIDGHHHYDDVYRDLTNFSPKVREDGLIIGHDFVNSTKTRRQKYGVVDAVRNFLHDNKEFKLILLTNEDHPSFVISKSPNSNVCKTLISNILKSREFVIKLDFDDFSSIDYMQENFNFPIVSNESELDAKIVPVFSFKKK
jgi:hypothetical protein